jgi:predicted metal-dependent hydrolase
LPPALPARKFVTGEGFPYLGRSYRLQVVRDLDVPVKLEEGRFRMRRDEAARGRATLVRWYTLHAQPWLAERVARHAGRVRVDPGSVTVQDLGFRWGSCGRGGQLHFHWQVILLPARIIDYIVVHELAHVSEPHHTPKFWRAVERAMPDWEQRRRWLAERGGEFVV